VGASPTRQPLQPEAIGAVMEVTKWLNYFAVGAFERVLQLHQRLGGEEGQAPSGACSETRGLRLGTME
jgi:hypothetical protein